MNILDKLRTVSPTQFENLVFDLLLFSGLRNVSWRTPGADGGRDLEGHFLRIDFAGVASLEKWYVECKRYANALSWPELRGKIAFAENHDAEYLLLCTTATLSTTCKDELARWHARGARPRIRAWEGAELENRVSLLQPLLLKYGLTAVVPSAIEPALPLLQLAERATASAYGRAAFNDKIDPELEYAACVVELAQAVARDGPGRRPTQIVSDRDLFSWVDVASDADLSGYDALGLRALLCALRSAARCATVRVSRRDQELALTTNGGTRWRDGHDLLHTVALWSNLESSVDGGTVTLRRRKS